MANSTLKTRIILNNKLAEDWKKDTETVWLKGEVLIESDTRKVKIGDGVNTYAKLQYAYLTPEEIEELMQASSHTHDNKTILDATTASFTTELLAKLNGIDTAKVLADAKAYADKKVSDLVNGAPETMDTLKEVSDALAENKDVVDALNSAIGNKAEKSDLTAHTGNADIHVTKEQKTSWDGAATHAESEHAPADAERNTIVSIKKNGVVVNPGTDRSVDITMTKSDVGLSNVDNTADANKNVATAAKLKTAKNFSVTGAVTADAVAFDGSQNVTLNATSVDAAKLVLNPGDILILDGSL